MGAGGRVQVVGQVRTEVADVIDNALKTTGTVQVSNFPNPQSIVVSGLDDGVSLPVRPADGPAMDAFARLRVSNPTTVFESNFRHSKQETLWSEELVGTASSTHDADSATVNLTISGINDSVVRQTKEYHRYQPGKSQLIFQTFSFPGPQPGVRARVGYFDGSNGIYLERAAETVSVVQRSSSTGVTIESKVPKNFWNLDTLDSLNLDKTNILIIDLEWLGVGRVRIGFVIDGIPVYVHEFNNANAQNQTYMGTGSLPCRVELEATGDEFEGTPTMQHICTSVQSEGGQRDDTGQPFSAVNLLTKNSAIGTFRPLVAIRLKQNFGGITNHVKIVLTSVQVLNQGTAPVIARVIIGATFTGAIYNSVNANSAVEFDVSGTAIATGGIPAAEFFVPSSNQAQDIATTNFFSTISLTQDLLGNRNTIAVAVAGLAAVPCNGAISWLEFQ